MQEPDAAAVADALTRVYTRPEFREREPPALLQLLSDLWAAVMQWLGRLLDGLLGGVGEWSPLVSRLLVAALAVAAVLAAAHLLARALRVRSPAAPAVGPEVRPLETDPAAWETRARRARQEGRLREAALALYQAAVLRLDARGAVRFHEGKTPGDYRREARADPGAGPLFDGFVRVLLPLAFAAEAPEPEAFEELRRAAAGMGVDA